MLNTPNIFKTPDSVGKAIGSYQAGCGYFNGHRDWSCPNYNGTCIDTSYTKTDVEGGAGAVLTGAGIVVTVIGIIVAS